MIPGIKGKLKHEKIKVLKDKSQAEHRDTTTNYLSNKINDIRLNAFYESVDVG